MYLYLLYTIKCILQHEIYYEPIGKIIEKEEKQKQKSPPFCFVQ